jgi:dTDP-4-dehydrorhamnose 3,5-epimerase-like enzyme
MLNERYKETADASIHKFDFHSDSRGSLFVQDFSNFPVKFVRLFVSEGMESGSIRGQHAHKECWLFVYASGSGITLNISNTSGSNVFVLDSSMGVLIPPYNWTEIHFKEKGSRLNVLASHPYDLSDYIYESP